MEPLPFPLRIWNAPLAARKMIRSPAGSGNVLVEAGDAQGRAQARRGPGSRPVQESANVVVRMATIGSDGPTGPLQEDVGELSW
jgi:hypothetical protein